MTKREIHLSLRYKKHSSSQLIGKIIAFLIPRERLKILIFSVLHILRKKKGPSGNLLLVKIMVLKAMELSQSLLRVRQCLAELPGLVDAYECTLKTICIVVLCAHWIHFQCVSNCFLLNCKWIILPHLMASHQLCIQKPQRAC